MATCLGRDLVQSLRVALGDVLMHMSLHNPGLLTPELRVSDHVFDHDATEAGPISSGPVSQASVDQQQGMGTAYLRFRSRYTGLHAMLEGAVHGVAAAVCGRNIGMQLIRGGIAAGELGIYQLTFPLDGKGKADSRELAHIKASQSYSPSPELFSSLFPFHFILDEACRLKQVGGECGLMA